MRRRDGEGRGGGQGEELGEGERQREGEGGNEGGSGSQGEELGEGEGQGDGEDAGQGDGEGQESVESQGDGEGGGAAVGRRAAVVVALGVAALAIGAARVGLDPERAGQPIVVGAFAVVYGALAIGAVLWLRRRGDARLLRPASGDIALGATSAAVLYAGAMAARMALATAGTPREAWIVRLYLQLGVADALRLLGRPEATGPLFGRAVVITTALYVIANVPSVLLLRDPTAGPNPLLVLGALAGGVVWTGLYLRRGRLLPAVFSHALFSWAMVEFPLWR
jgi:membrane protease YdiL (CAAX protease family)